MRFILMPPRGLEVGMRSPVDRWPACGWMAGSEVRRLDRARRALLDEGLLDLFPRDLGGVRSGSGAEPFRGCSPPCLGGSRGAWRVCHACVLAWARVWQQREGAGVRSGW